MIGIGITTKNRLEVFLKTMEYINKFAPTGSTIALVDDGSDKEIDPALFIKREDIVYEGFRFDESVGIARAKNKCFELLEGHKHIFLFDDDTYPIAEDWWKPYTESKEPHLMYIFQDFSGHTKLNDTAVIYQDSTIVASSHARGCMLYYQNICLREVGGMDPIFGKWGFEHPDLSNRIYNAGLTTFRYMDVPNSNKLIYSSDEHQAVTTTVSGHVRNGCIQRNESLYKAYYDRVKYIDYIPAEQDVVITTFFNGMVDPQRPEQGKWEADASKLTVLLDSLKKHSVKCVVLTDCFEQKDFAGYDVWVQKVEATMSPYWQRWFSIQQLLKKRKFNRVFCVDATDVEMLKNPFLEELEYQLYFGDEKDTLSHPWMSKYHPAQFLQTFFRHNRHTPILNAGILGGHSEVVLMFLDKLMDQYFENVEGVKRFRHVTVGEIDMGLFNYVAHTYFPFFIVHGDRVNTTFKANEYNDKSWFKHK